MTFTQLIEKVGALSDAISDHNEREGRKAHPHYPWIYPGEPEALPAPEQAELERLLEALPAETLYEVALVLDVGLFWKPVDDVPGLLEEAKRHFGKPDAALWSLVNQRGLSEEYIDGLSRLAKAGFDPDRPITVPLAA